jgi:hypothetical protein
MGMNVKEAAMRKVAISSRGWGLWSVSSIAIILLSGGILAGPVFAADRPSQNLFEGYGRLYQQDQQAVHEMMEMMKELMGTMKEMSSDAKVKSMMEKRMERMGAMMKEHAERPSQALFGEGYGQLYQRDREMVHEMMEMMNEMMGMMKGMAPDAGMKGKIGQRMERMDALMKEHSEAPNKALFGTGYPFQSR